MYICVYIYIYIYIYIYMYLYIFIYIHIYIGHMSSTWTQCQFCTTTPISYRLFSVRFHFSYCFRQSPRLF